jgi:hypothetical protein
MEVDKVVVQLDNMLLAVRIPNGLATPVMGLVLGWKNFFFRLSQTLSEDIWTSQVVPFLRTKAIDGSVQMKVNALTALVAIDQVVTQTNYCVTSFLVSIYKEGVKGLGSDYLKMVLLICIGLSSRGAPADILTAVKNLENEPGYAIIPGINEALPAPTDGAPTEGAKTPTKLDQIGRILIAIRSGISAADIEPVDDEVYVLSLRDDRKITNPILESVRACLRDIGVFPFLPFVTIKGALMDTSRLSSMGLNDTIVMILLTIDSKRRHEGGSNTNSRSVALPHVLSSISLNPSSYLGILYQLSDDDLKIFNTICGGSVKGALLDILGRDHKFIQPTQYSSVTKLSAVFDGIKELADWIDQLVEPDDLESFIQFGLPAWNDTMVSAKHVAHLTRIVTACIRNNLLDLFPKYVNMTPEWSKAIVDAIQSVPTTTKQLSVQMVNVLLAVYESAGESGWWEKCPIEISIASRKGFEYVVKRLAAGESVIDSDNHRFRTVAEMETKEVAVHIMTAISIVEMFNQPLSTENKGALSVLFGFAVFRSLTEKSSSKKFLSMNCHRMIQSSENLILLRQNSFSTGNLKLI